MTRLSGYWLHGYEAAYWGVSRFANPVPVWFSLERLAWADGHRDASLDDLPRAAPRHEPECVGLMP